MIDTDIELFVIGDIIDWSDRPNVKFVEERVGPGPFRVLRVEDYTSPNRYHPQTVYFSKEVDGDELVYATANLSWGPPKENASEYFYGPSPFSGYWFKKISKV